jgi:hypothetical protein
MYGPPRGRGGCDLVDSGGAVAQEKARLTRVRRKKDEPEAAKTPVKAVRRRTRKQFETPAIETVAFHAYLLWESGAPGDATEHWLRAERELAAA